MPKFPHLFYIFIGIIVGFLFSQGSWVQAQSACSDGSWRQPVCDPTAVDPDTCNINPPLFSNANCLQSTGYLKILDVDSPFAKAKWVDLQPGRVMIGEVQGRWEAPTDGSLEVSGPIVSGNFSSIGSSYNSSGDITAYDSVYVGNQLRVINTAMIDGTATFKNRVTMTASAGSGQTVLYVTNSSLGGNILYLDGPGGDVYFDASGYMNAPNDYFINSSYDLQLKVGTSGGLDDEFRIKRGDDRTILRLTENSSGPTIPFLRVQGIGSQNDVSGNAYDGIIRGNFVESVSGGSCGSPGNTKHQLLYWNDQLNGWFCIDIGNVGTTNATPTLLQVLQTGADASAFFNPVEISVSGISGTDYGFTLKGSPSQYPVFNLKDNEANNNAGAYLGVINFGDNYNVMNQASIIGLRGASGSTSDYPTNLSFWTTPDASTVAQQRMTINYQGYVGIGVINPTALLHVSAGTTGDAIFLLEADTDDSGSENDNPYIKLEQDGGTTEGILGMTGSDGNAPNGSPYTDVIRNSLFLGNYQDHPLQLGTDDIVRMTIAGGSAETGGYVGLGTKSPNRRLHIYQPSGTHNAEIDIQSVAGSLNWWAIYHDRGSDDLRFWQGGDKVTFTDDGDVGIGVTSPTSKLQVNGTIRGNFTDYLGNSCTTGQVLVYGASGWICTTGVGSQDLASVLAIGNSAGSYDIDMNDHDIINPRNIGSDSRPVSKITVLTIDPVYTIDGKKYATYMAGMTGVKEETSGVLNLSYDQASGLARAVIDFSQEEKGSDLWLFARTINYQDNFDKITVLLTAGFDGRIWYQKDAETNQLIILAEPVNQSAGRYEASYRLTGPRFDYQSWPNVPVDNNHSPEGLDIDKFLRVNK